MKPAIHARDHRPAGTMGPDDPGGADPLGAWAFGGGVFETYRQCVLGHDDLLAYLPFDDAAGSATVEEVVGDRAATVTVGVGGYPIFGVQGVFPGLPDETQAEFDNAGASTPFSAGRIDLAWSVSDRNLTFAGNHAWAVKTFVYRDGAQANSQGFIFENWNGSGGQATSLSVVTSGGIEYLNAVRGGTTIGSTVLSPLPLTTEVEVWLAYDGATLGLYMDEVLVASGASATSITADDSIAIGNNNNAGGTGFRIFNGRIAHFQVYSAVNTEPCLTGGAGGGPDAPEFTTGWADGSGGVSWHLVREENIEDAAVTTDKIAPSSVTAAKVAADVATQAELDAHITDTTDAHDASAVSVADAGGYYTATEVEAALQEIGADLAAPGRWELVMQDGVTAPPVPVETEAQDDWVYVLVED